MSDSDGQPRHNNRPRGYSLRRMLLKRQLKNDRRAPSPIELQGYDAEAHYNDSHADIMASSRNQPKRAGDKKLGEDCTNAPTSDVLPNYSFWASTYSSSTASKMKAKFSEAFHRAQDVILQKRRIPDSVGGRRIPIELDYDDLKLIDERTKRRYVGNEITSSIYTPYNFLPRQLIYQFGKLANLYFLFVSILQMIPSWSTTGSYTTIIPLAIFVSISMGREGYDDWRRHKQDKEENNRLSHVAHLTQPGSNIEYKPCAWKDIKVGAVIKIKQNEWVPADVIVLSATGHHNSAYIETMDLDGETNLKTREAVPDLADITNNNEEFANVSDCYVQTEDPNVDLYNFEGTLSLHGKSYPLNPSNVIYRGSIVRNTAEVVALVIFTGEESKIRMNALQNPKSKSPKLQKKVNNIVIFMVIFVIALSVFCTVACRIYYSTQGKQAWYIRNADVTVIQNLMGFIIMFNTLIPLSLYVSLEIIKVSQMLMLQLDVDMYHEPTNTPCEAHTASINEELGQVHYIFSDKTGTLTDNVMVFRKLTVAGRAWLHELDIQMEAAAVDDDIEEDLERQKPKLFHHAKSAGSQLSGAPESSAKVVPISDSPQKPLQRQSTDAILRQVTALPRKSSVSRMSRKSRKSMASLKRSVSGVAWKSTAAPDRAQNVSNTLELLQFMMTNPTSAYTQKAKFFLLAIALCHTCVPEVDKNDGDHIDNLEYQAASPDELALVEAARDLGYIVIDRQHNSVTLRTYPEGFDSGPADEVYEILQVIDFSSARKRMSIVCKFPDGRFCVICKGADSVIMERLRLKALADEKLKEITDQAALRKEAEADAVIARNSLSSLKEGGGVIALARPSFGKPSLDKRDRLASLDGYLHRVHKDEDVDMIAESSRKSMTLTQKRKYADATGRRSADIRGRYSVDGKGKKNEAVTSRSINASPKLEKIAAETEEEPIEIEDRLVYDDSYVMEKTMEHIEEFSTEGLRTLMYAHRFLSKEEFAHWNKVYQDARTSLVDRQEKTEKIGAMIEKDFELTGATAIEDKLQEGVPEAIEKLTRAQIKLWMLTGDKRETAINIGYSCRLIKDYSTVVILRSDEGDVAGRMASAMVELDSGDRVAHCVVVVDGQTLAHIQDDITLMSLFIDLGVKANSVICCRASPSQKAAMVQAVRQKLRNTITLAIGDGANDIAMIQSADVGIGIAGREGLQAARSSDYSIAQFRFLLKLLLVHGRWNYVRTCKYVLVTFYKEFLFYLSQAIYQRNTMFTGTSLYESWSLSMFNTLFTSLPVICLGIFEQDLSPTTLIAVPELYTMGQQNQRFGFVLFVGWITVAAMESVGVSFLNFYMWGDPAIIDASLYPLGMVSFTSILLIITFKINVLEQYYITFINFAVIFIENAGWLCWSMLLSKVYESKRSIYYVEKGIFQTFGTDASWWAAILVIFGLLLMFEYVLRLVRSIVLPTDTDVFQEMEQDPDIRFRLEQEAYSELKQGWEYRGDVESRLFDEHHRPRHLTPSGVNSRMASNSFSVRSDEQEYLDGTSRPSGHVFFTPQNAYDDEGPSKKPRQLLRKLPFVKRKTSADYEREVLELLKRREQQLNET